MNDRQPTFDVVHMQNHRYDPMAFASEQAWTCEVIGAWLASCEDEVATAVATALSDSGVSCLSEVMQESRPFGAETIRAETIAHSQAGVIRKDIEASIKKWRGATDLAVRLNCPCRKEKDTNAHYLRFDREPTVAAARRKHLSLFAAATHTSKLKKSTANTLAAMYDLDDLGRHINPGADDNGICEDLIKHLIGTNPGIEPTRGALFALLQMGSSERTQGRFPKQFGHGMFLLGETIDKIRTSQAHIVRLATETEMWSARCKMLHSGRATGTASRKVASDECADELKRTEIKHLPVLKMLYRGLPSSKRKDFFTCGLPLSPPGRTPPWIYGSLRRLGLNRPRNKSGERRK